MLNGVKHLAGNTIIMEIDEMLPCGQHDKAFIDLFIPNIVYLHKSY